MFIGVPLLKIGEEEYKRMVEAKMKEAFPLFFDAQRQKEHDRQKEAEAQRKRARIEAKLAAKRALKAQKEAARKPPPPPLPRPQQQSLPPHAVVPQASTTLSTVR